MEINTYIKNNTLKIIVKTNSNKTEVTGYNETKKALIVNVNAAPVDNKANIEIIKYFSKLINKKVRIKSGISSKEKILKIE